MARDVGDDTYYKITGGKIPVKWTAPEVSELTNHVVHHSRMCMKNNSTKQIVCNYVHI